jgi:hypothetical protein
MTFMMPLMKKDLPAVDAVNVVWQVISHELCSKMTGTTVIWLLSARVRNRLIADFQISRQQTFNAQVNRSKCGAFFVRVEPKVRDSCAT